MQPGQQHARPPARPPAGLAQPGAEPPPDQREPGVDHDPATPLRQVAPETTLREVNDEVTSVASVNLHEARTHLSRLVERAAAGEEIVIARAGRPVAKLVPLERDQLPRRPGGMEGLIRMADDFDAPLPSDLLTAFYRG